MAGERVLAEELEEAIAQLKLEEHQILRSITKGYTFYQHKKKNEYLLYLLH
jgi:hypothetical protein